MQAMGLAIDKARQFAAGIVSVRHGFHFGTAGRYARQAAEAGCVGIAMCNTRPLMPAPGGAERVVGNNPLAIAVPTAGRNSDRARHGDERSGDGQDPHGGKSQRADPADLGRDRAGTADDKSDRGHRRHAVAFGGPKGFGLSFLIDLLCGLLSQGASGAQVRPLYGDFSVPYDCSHLFIAIDVAHFCDLDWFRAQAASAAERIRDGKRAPGVASCSRLANRNGSGAIVPAARSSLDPAVVAMLATLRRTSRRCPNSL